MTKEPMSTKWCDDVHDAPQIASLRRKLRRMRRTLVAVMNTAGHIEGMVLTMVDELRKLEDKLSATIRDAAIRDAAKPSS